MRDRNVYRPERRKLRGVVLDRPLPVNTIARRLGPELDAAVDETLRDWTANDKVARLWAHDASLWTDGDESKWLGWLDVIESERERLAELGALAAEVQRGGFSNALLLGMGGSSLCPEVLRETFGRAPGFPDLAVLDSTDPAQIRAIAGRVDLARTLCIVSSKSGTTLEPNIFLAYFLDRVRAAVGPEAAPKRFVAITDPGSKLAEVAGREGFWRVFDGVPSIGGRYSALSAFGLVPAAAMGLDVGRLLERAAQMREACLAGRPAVENPGAVLGAILGVLGRAGRDKVTLVASPGIVGFGAWLEQLLAESTGKNGRGLVPVDDEALAPPDRYGADRLFAYLRLETTPDLEQDRAVDAIERAGHPVVRLGVPSATDLAQEFFRWEFATAVAGSILGIHPFDQPDVEASKIATRRLTEAYEQTGNLPAEEPFFSGEGVRLFADPANANTLREAVGAQPSLGTILRAHIGRLRAGDYFALLAYLARDEANEQSLARARHAVRDHARVATCLGFGPRFLHSTGQAYKGGPNTGVFLQVTCDDAEDLDVPGQRYSFGIVKAAQARGDFEVLAERGRRALRVHLGGNVGAGLRAFEVAVREALHA